MSARVLVCLALILCAPAARSQYVNRFTPPPEPKPVDTNALLAAAQATAEKLRTATVRWQVGMRVIEDDLTLRVEVLSTPVARRTIVYQADPGSRLTELARVLEVGRAWYVTEGGRRRKFRPYEADLKYAVATYAHGHAGARPVTADDARGFGKLIDRSGPVARFLAPPADPHQLRQQLNHLRAVKPPGLSDEEVGRRVEWYRTALEGAPVDVDVETGLILTYRAERFQADFFDFAVLQNGADADLDPGTREWEDCTGDVAAGRPEDVAIVERTRRASRGATDAYLVNVVTGQTRRVPYQGPRAGRGCFLPGRAAVVVGGFDRLTNQKVLTEVDLATGRNRRVGSADLARGSGGMAVLSPDAATIASAYQPANVTRDENQILLIDRRTQTSRVLEPRFIAGCLNWLPDGRGFVLSRVLSHDPLTSETGTYAIDGGYTRSFGRSLPLLLADGKTVLSFDDAGRKWFLSDVDGRNERLFGDGFPQCPTLPSLSPDGKRLLMIEGVRGSELRPIVVDLDTLRTVAVPVEPGGWSISNWR
jgi:hypothetical protein